MSPDYIKGFDDGAKAMAESNPHPVGPAILLIGALSGGISASLFLWIAHSFFNVCR